MSGTTGDGEAGTGAVLSGTGEGGGRTWFLGAPALLGGLAASGLSSASGRAFGLACGETAVLESLGEVRGASKPGGSGGKSDGLLGNAGNPLVAGGGFTGLLEMFGVEGGSGGNWPQSVAGMHNKPNISHNFQLRAIGRFSFGNLREHTFNDNIGKAVRFLESATRIFSGKAYPFIGRACCPTIGRHDEEVEVEMA